MGGVFPGPGPGDHEVGRGADGSFPSRAPDDPGGLVHIWPRSPCPLRSSFDGGGTNFAISSAVAERIELSSFLVSIH